MSVDKIEAVCYDGKTHTTLSTTHKTNTSFSFVIHDLNALKAKTEPVFYNQSGCSMCWAEYGGYAKMEAKEAILLDSVAAFEDWLRETLDAPIKL